MKYRYEAFIIDEESDDIVVSVESASLEGLQEEMSKKKFTEAVERYEDENIIPDEEDEEDDDKFQTMRDNEFAETRSNAVQDSGFMGVID